MKKGKISRVYIQIVASFLCIFLFAGGVLTFASVWFSRKSKEDFLEKIWYALEANDDKLIGNLECIYKTSGSILKNQIVTDNLREYSSLNAENRYNYRSIVDLLNQAHFQFDGLIDSIFLYTDDVHVLYSSKEKGMTMTNAFFNSIMRYDSYNASYWGKILDESGPNYMILPPDRYVSYIAHDEHVVIPLVYYVPGVTGENVLVINLSCDNILKLSALSVISPQTRMGIYSSEGALVVGDVGIPEVCPEMSHAQTMNVDGKENFVFIKSQPALGISICAFVPVSALADSMAFYWLSIGLLWAVFIGFSTVIAIAMSHRAYAPILQVHKSIRSIPEVDSASTLNNELEFIQKTISKLVDEREFYRTQNHQHSYHYITQGFTALLGNRKLEDDVYFASLLLKEYRFNMQKFLCIDVLIDSVEESEYVSKIKLVEEARSRIHAAFQEGPPMFSLLYHNNMLVLLVDSEKIDNEQIYTKISNVGVALSNWCSFRIGIGESVDQLNLLSYSFEKANSAVFALSTAIEANCNEPFSYNRNEILNAVNTHDIKCIEEVAYRILNRAKIAAIPYASVVNILQDIVEAVIGMQYRFGTQSLPTEHNIKINPLEILLLSPEINIAPLAAALLPYIPYQAVMPEKSSAKIVNRLRVYIEKHFSEDLCLDILADKMDISSKYLSRIFKQSIGMNLSEYLARVRVEKAKELLLTDMSIQQIMESIGIYNRTTFTRMFRRLEGITPSEYRNLRNGTMDDED